MLNVALTGNIAAGKSAVAALLARWGAVVIDADTLVRELQRPGEPVFDAIVERFGREILAADGTLDRARLRARVFADPDARAALERIVHPAVQVRRAAMIDAARARGERVAVSDIPLLFESAAQGGLRLDEFDAVVLVDAPSDVRRRRLVELRGLAPAAADAMIAAQMPSAEKRDRSTWIIENDADLATLERRTRAVWDRIVGQAPA